MRHALMVPLVALLVSCAGPAMSQAGASATLAPTAGNTI
jgi:hypothetical protein